MSQNMKAVKLRMKSIQSTKQITNAMGLVASSKLKKAKDKADATLPAYRILKKTLRDIANNNNDFTSPYTKENGNEKWCFVVLAGDRGLAGGYNSNLFKFVAKQAEGKDCAYITIGNRAKEYYQSKGVEIIDHIPTQIAAMSISQCFELARQLCKSYLNKEFGHIAICYTEFQNMLTMKTKSVPLLPISDFADEAQESDKVKNTIEYKPDPEEVFNAIVPEFEANLIYSAVCESLASELAARRNAMDAATKNAEEMLGKLELSYNRARQASITQEITEIVAGASD